MNRKKMAVTWMGVMLSLTFVVIFVKTAPVTAKTIYVDDDGTADYSNIQAAIDIANPGDTVYVYSGTYYENLDIPKTISLIGENREVTIINGSGNGGEVIKIMADGVNISGLKITGCMRGHSGIELASVNNCTIFNNNISLNEYIGIRVRTSNNNRILNNMISSNELYGIYLKESHNIEIINNTTSHNYFGVFLYDSKYTIIHNNHFINDGINIGGQYIENWDTHTISSSNMIGARHLFYWKNRVGDVIPNGAGQIILVNCSNFLIENQTSDECPIGVTLAFSSNNTITNNDLSNSLFGLNLFMCINNIITSNNVYGFVLYGSKYNTISHNIVTNADEGIYGFHSIHNRIENNSISGNNYGIYLLICSNNIIVDNILYSNRYGDIYLYAHCNNNTIITNNLIESSGIIMITSGENNTLSGNRMVNCSIHLGGDRIEYWNSHTIETTNLVNGKPVYYWINRSNGTISESAGQVILFNCTNILIENLHINNASVGIHLSFSYNITMNNNTLSKNSYGITLRSSNYNILTDNILSDNTYGINFEHARYNTIINNTISANTYGLEIGFYSNSNLIYNNNFILNHFSQANDPTGNNYWNATYPHGGNYWSDYSNIDDYKGAAQDVEGSDGIWDAPFPVQFGKTNDSYPLTVPASTGQTTPLSVPHSPRGLRVLNYCNFVWIIWSQPTYDGGSKISGYNLYRKSMNDTEYSFVTNINQTFFRDINVTNNVTYYYKISAFNDVGEGPMSNEANATLIQETLPSDIEQPLWLIYIVVITFLSVLIGFVNNHIYNKNRKK